MSLVLTLNAGSSSLKFSAWQDSRRLCRGEIEPLGPDAHVTVETARRSIRRRLGAADHRAAVAAVIEVLHGIVDSDAVAAIGHRIVHGGPDRDGPVVLTDAVLADLGRFARFAPLHQPHNLACVRAAQAAFPQALEVGCFDTAFHRGHPWVNDTFALPRRFYDEGVRRYGFHGLSYEYLTHHVIAAEPELAAGRVIVAHLGNGASVCAVEAGRSVGSTMGFSALDGLPMGTRCGQIDPGVLLYLFEQGMDAQDLSHLLYRESGLLGLSGISHDMRELEASAAPEARQAIDYYVFRIGREIGAMAAVLGGVDGLIFSGGIGANSALVRARATERLAHLGIRLDRARNAAGGPEIGAGAVRVLALPTDEETVVAGHTLALLRRA